MKIRLKKGLDLKLAGGIADTSAVSHVDVSRCAVVPDDFPGFIPKMEVKEGDEVLQGQPLLRDKNHEEVKIVSPVAGKVVAVVRGERRKIERVVVEQGAGSETHFDAYIGNVESALRLICASGLLTHVRQRPYDIVPDPNVRPRDIFVTAMDTSPLSPGLMPALAGKEAYLAKGVEVLATLTDGKVYLSVGSDWTHGTVKGAEMVEVTGPHPSGLVGVQVANIAPVNKGEVVWTLDVVTLAKIGMLAERGVVDTTTVVALTGSEVKIPHLISTVEGAEIVPLIKDQTADSDRHLRVISGNVLTGTVVETDGFLRYPYRQITVIPEGDDVAEFMGWASLDPKKMSVSRSFPGHFFGKMFSPDARVLGGRRAMIMSGEYDKVMPMDIMTEYLLKAIIARDIEQMEKLGIYEVAPEDFALAEYVDTSKQPIQQIVRDGLDYLRKELS